MNKLINQVNDLNVEELSLLDKLVFSIKGAYLSDLQKTILRYSLDNYTYDEIAEKEGYSEKYLKRDVGPKLWKILSIALGEKVGKKNFREALDRKIKEINKISNLDDNEKFKNTSQKVLSASGFWGRTQELAKLQQWILNDSSNLVVIFGMAGIGKTVLVQKLAQQIDDYFEQIIWFSPVQNIFQETNFDNFYNNLSDSFHNLCFEEIENKTCKDFFHYLLNHKILIVIDDFDFFYRTNDLSCHQEKGVKFVLNLIEYMENSWHQSCLILLSREKPKFSSLKKNNSIRWLELKGMKKSEVETIFSYENVIGSKNEWEQLINIYENNPKFLSIALSKISSVFNKNIFSFIEKGFFVFGEINACYRWYHMRLTEEEKEIMYWLAIFQEDISIKTIQQYFISSKNSLATIMEVIETLQDLSLIYLNGDRFGLSFLTQKYFSEYLLQLFFDDLSQQNYNIIKSHSLLTLTLSYHIQECQINNFIKPLIERLINFFGKKELLKNHLNNFILKTKKKVIY